MNIRKNKNCNIKINDNSISNKSAKEQFEKLGYEERLKRIVNLQDDKEETIYYKIYDEDVKAIEYILNQNQQLKEENKDLKFKLEYEKENKKFMQDYGDAWHKNWNKLEEWLRTIYDYDEGVVSKDYIDCVDEVLSKMQEIGGSNE